MHYIDEGSLDKLSSVKFGNLGTNVMILKNSIASKRDQVEAEEN